jgi:hypothetical protein
MILFIVPTVFGLDGVTGAPKSLGVTHKFEPGEIPGMGLGIRLRVGVAMGTKTVGPHAAKIKIIKTNNFRITPHMISS